MKIHKSGPVIQLLEDGGTALQKQQVNTKYFRKKESLFIIWKHI